MKTALIATMALLAATFGGLSQASAAPPLTAAAPVSSTGAHWEWQYHYVGHHPRYVGYWVWVN